MSTKLLTFLLFLVSIFCFAQSEQSTIIDSKTVGKKIRTQNPNSPIIYENGFKNIEIVSIPTINEGNTVNLYELRFNEVLSSSYAAKLMYEKFGLWDKLIGPEGEKYANVAIWQNKKLLTNSNKLYTVYTTGNESWTKMYTSVMVFDNQNNDCLAKEGEEKEALIRFFKDSIINLKKDDQFYLKYKKANEDYASKR
jgi:hypothetical protein